MKKIVFVISLFTLLVSQVNANEFNYKNNSFPCKLFRVVHIDKTITSNEGCTIHIVGDADISIIPPRFNSFTGTITLGGPGSCPKGVLTFTKATASLTYDLEVIFNSDDPNYLTTLTWSGSNSAAVSLLNQSDVNSALVAELVALF